MRPNKESQPGGKEQVDPRSYKKHDRYAYSGIVVYSLINIIWIAWAYSIAKFGIFDTALCIGVMVPALGLLTLISYQTVFWKSRFSPLANIIAVVVIGGWFLIVWSIVIAASAAV